MVEEYKIYILKKANKDKEKIKQFPALKNNVDKLINLIKKNPFQTPLSYEILTKDLKGIIREELINNIDLFMKLLRRKKG